MEYFAFEQVRHGGEADMRMRPDVHPLAGREDGDTHLVEEGEGTHHAARHGGENPTNLETTQVAGTRVDHRLEHAWHGGEFIEMIRGSTP